VTDWAAAGVAEVLRVPATGDLRSGVAAGSETLAEPEPRSFTDAGGLPTVSSCWAFRKMVVRLERPQIPYSLPLGSFGAFALRGSCRPTAYGLLAVVSRTN
jgi:hypothetical protein